MTQANYFLCASVSSSVGWGYWWLQFTHFVAYSKPIMILPSWALLSDLFQHPGWHSIVLTRVTGLGVVTLAMRLFPWVYPRFSLSMGEGPYRVDSNTTVSWDLVRTWNMTPAENVPRMLFVPGSSLFLVTPLHPHSGVLWYSTFMLLQLNFSVFAHMNLDQTGRIVLRTWIQIPIPNLLAK